MVLLLLMAIIAGAYWFNRPRGGDKGPGGREGNGAGDNRFGPGNPAYEQYLEAFQVGVAALDADLPQIAEQNLNRAVELVPQEPAGWANRGLLFIRTARLPDADRDLAEANRLAPDDPQIGRLLGLLKQRQGDFGAAAEFLRKALARDPNDIQTIYALARIVDQEQKAGSDEAYQKLMEQILEREPSNLKVLSDLLRVVIRRGDSEAIQAAMRRFEPLTPHWQLRSRTALEALQKALAESRTPPTVPLLRFTNTLKGEKGFVRDGAEVDPPDALAGRPLHAFLKIPHSRPAPSAPDSGLTFPPGTQVKVPEGTWTAIRPVWLTGEGSPVVFVANPEEVRRLGSDLVLSSPAAGPQGLAPLDWNNDHRTDLALAGARGLKFYQQQPDGAFADQTAKVGLGDEVLGAAYHSALAVDVDLDADVDLILSRQAGSPVWLRNNSDGTFKLDPLFESAEGPQLFAWGDWDHDGVGDAALVDQQGGLKIFANDRSATLRDWRVPPPAEKFRSIAVADGNGDGVIDLIALQQDGSLVVISDRGERSGWDVRKIASEPALAGETTDAALVAADFDNNGAIDFLASTGQFSRLWLGAEEGTFKPLEGSLPPGLQGAADLRGTGRLDIVGLGTDGRPLTLQNAGTRDYHWLTLRPRSTPADGDNRINSFGIGGTVEIRTGSLVVKQPIEAPAVHFGLGERKQADVARIDWPNGAAQYEFALAPDKTIVAVQRLKGSCPFLYAWTGERFEFVTDFMWSTPLGMYINASDKGGFLQTTDWVKVPGRQLVPKEGRYELRVNANLWETHFFDHVALMVGDHPAGTEMFVDERFALVPTDPTMRLTGPPQPIAKALDHHGKDATREVLEEDGIHLDRAGRGHYQGVTNDHWVEVDLGDRPFAPGPVWLIARGWVHPTDSSVNYALGQGNHTPPRGLVLEIPDGQGGWKVGQDKLGFPAGKNKTVLVRLDGLDGEGVSRRFRLRTNMEIYWDSLRVAEGRDDSLARRQTLLSTRADLRSRGVVAMTQASPSAPELPHYDQIVSGGQPWRDLIGYHTRFGEIGELLSAVDDRYAILSAGDDIDFEFPAAELPPDGFVRDFIWVSDGWVKDGDFNTRFGKTVLPLPLHGMASYDVPPKELEDDPAYRKFPQDWETYHTRFISPELFRRGLRGLAPRQTPAGDRRTP